MLFPWQLSALMRCLRAGLCDGCAAKTALSERSFEIFTAASVFFERRERDYRGLEYARDSAGFACFFLLPAARSYGTGKLRPDTERFAATGLESQPLG